MPRKVFSSYPCRLSLAWLLCACVSRAVYAPVPETEREKALSFNASIGSYYDTNIFGAPVDARSSLVFQTIPQLHYNLSVQKQTWVSLGYRLQWDHFVDRPSHRDLDGHRFTAKVAHTFAPRLESQLDAHLDFVRNPESLLPGVGQLLTGSQSYRSFTLESTTNWLASKRSNVSLRIKALDLAYETDELSSELDRREALITFSYGYLVSPRSMALLEADVLPVRYRNGGELKDKDVYRLLSGYDYVVAKTVALTLRFGGELRRRNEGRDPRPYGELGWKWDYAKGSYLSTGYAYALDEVSNLTRYNDISVHRFFVNALHSLGPRLSAGATFGWEPSTLNGRKGVWGNVSETTLKGGLSLTYHLRPRWDFSATLDRDQIDSGDNARHLSRTRAGFSSEWRF